MSVSVATSATVRFDESAFSARILSIKFGGITRTPIEFTRMSDTDRQFWTGDTSDAGEFELEVQFNPDTVPPFWCDTETVSLTWPNLERWTGPMFASGYKCACPMDGVMRATLMMKIAGPVQVVALSPLKNDDNNFVYNDSAQLVYVG